ncbi:MAG: hypothetical protein ACJ72N_07430 [Labedaea sp.]|jgi:hypothetical protein
MNGYDDGKIIERLRAEVARLTAERDAKMSRPAELFMDVLKSARGVNHPILDTIATALTADDAWSPWAVERMGECLEFRDADGRRFEIVVRPIEEERP